jgi:hypothetical protein
MTYPDNEFLVDYSQIGQSAVPVSSIPGGMIPDFVRLFFMAKYGKNSPIGDDRAAQMLRVVNLLRHGKESLLEHGFLEPDPATKKPQFHVGLLLALHHLINREGKEQPTVEEITARIMASESGPN